MQRIEKDSSDLIKGIQAPEGWEVTVDIDAKNVQELQHFDGLKKKVGLYLPFITKRLEVFKARAERNSHIIIPSSHIFVDADGSFEVILLVNKEDFLSPDMIGLRLDASGYLQNIGDMNIRLKFAIAEEYNKFNLSKRPFKLRYSYGNPSSFRKAS